MHLSLLYSSVTVELLGNLVQYRTKSHPVASTVGLLFLYNYDYTHHSTFSCVH